MECNLTKTTKAKCAQKVATKKDIPTTVNFYTQYFTHVQIKSNIKPHQNSLSSSSLRLYSNFTGFQKKIRENVC